MRSLLTFLLLAITATGFAQKQNVYFLKNDGRYLNSKDSADIIRIVSEPDPGTELYNVSEYYKSGKRKLVAKSTEVDPPKFEGIVITSYEDGSRKAVNNYVNNLLLGDQYYFYPNGKLYMVKNYTGILVNNVQREFIITANNDSLGAVLVTNGNGYFKAYDDDFKYVIEEGALNNGRKNGEWKYQDSLGRRVESYDDGKFISGTSTGKDGEITTYTIREVLPSYPGGADAFLQFLVNNIRYPLVDRQNMVQGKVVLTFVVEKNGKLSDIKVLRSVSPGIDAEAVRVMQQSKLWKPGYQYGKPVRAQYTVPISFSLGAAPAR